MHKAEEERMDKVVAYSYVFNADIFQGFVPKAIDISSEEEARAHNADAMCCSRFCLVNRHDAKGMDEAMRYIMQWVTYSPDVTVGMIDIDSVFLTRAEYMLSYVAGCVFVGLQNGYKTFTLDMYHSGIASVLARYEAEKDVLGRTDELEKWIDMLANDKDAFDKMLEEKFSMMVKE